MSVDIDAGFEVAPGEANDVEVANAHACWYLIISDARRLAALARVTACSFSKGNNVIKSHDDILCKGGRVIGGVYLECSAAGRMSTGGV